jgi:D-alanyl-lipoteichoic acid acyltransferase DltB (MBOAT superfamily)
MLFNSGAFLIFFPAVTTLYFLLPHRFRWILLLSASCFFYMYLIPVYILILLFTIGVDYCAGLLIEGAHGARRKHYLLASVAANIGVLALFKYFNFVNDNIRTLASSIHWNYSVEHLGWLLPVGLSFHTFQAMSYTIEVYYGRQRAERHLGLYALYVLFYPQLVAGPIERPQNLLHQFREPHVFDVNRITSGLQQMLWGLFKKVVIADRLAIYADSVFNHPTGHGGLDILVATYCFAIQIYCDFSGYSDIAIGAARVMGFTLMTNFRTPYGAQSVREFWQRWHISLSTWFRDYVYIPLGGARVSPTRWVRNVLITFVVSGLWHGASWTFIIWGALHGLYVVTGAYLQAPRRWLAAWVGLEHVPDTLRACLRTVVTFHLVLIAWVFFRAHSVPEALDLLGRVASWAASGFRPFSLQIVAVPSVLFMLALVIATAVYERRSRVSAPELVRMSSASLQLWMVLVFGVFDNRQFIYFQF